MGLLLSNEADIWILLFKYGSNFSYATGPKYGEEEGVSSTGLLKTTTTGSYLFMFLYGHRSCPSKAGRRVGVVQPTHFIPKATEAQRGKGIYSSPLSKPTEGGRLPALEQK